MDSKVKLNEWNLVGIKLFKANKKYYASIILNEEMFDPFEIDECVEEINYLLVANQANLIVNTSTATSSGTTTGTTSNLNMPFKVCLMSFGAYEYTEVECKAIYNEGLKYLFKEAINKSNATIYYDEKVYDGFDVITLNGSLESTKGLKPVKIATIAQNMGISVVDRSISADGSIFGQVYFKDTKADLYDRRSGVMQTVLVPKNTMIIDSDSSSLFSFGCQKLTIAHECVHFYLHKKAFFFAKMVNKELSHIQCQREGGIVGKNEGTNNHWMEVQANGIAPYILMPRQMVVKKYNELENMYMSWGQTPLEYAESLVKAIADFFDVTNYAARKRLLDLGFTLAGGTLNYVDGQYIKPYLYKKGALAKDETYTVSYKDIYDKIFSSTMGAYIYQGNFVFVENHLCIESPKYVQKTEEGDHELTVYAREHLDECCVKFKCTSRSSVIRDSLATACYLCRQFDEDLYYDLEIADSNSALYNSPNLPFAFKEHRDRILQIKKDIMGKSFTEILNYFVDNLHKDNKELAYDSGLDERSIRRYLSGESKRPDKRSVIAICMALKLPSEITDIVLKQAHISLVEGDTEDDALMGVIMTHRGKSIKKINAYLERLGVEPLNNASF